MGIRKVLVEQDKFRPVRDELGEESYSHWSRIEHRCDAHPLLSPQSLPRRHPKWVQNYTITNAPKQDKSKQSSKIKHRLEINKIGHQRDNTHFRAKNNSKCNATLRSMPHEPVQSINGRQIFQLSRPKQRSLSVFSHSILGILSPDAVKLVQKMVSRLSCNKEATGKDI